METRQFRGILVENAFLRTKKFTQHYEWLRRAAGQCNMDLDSITNADLIYPICSGDADVCQESRQKMEKLVEESDFILYWDKDILLGSSLQEICKKNRVRIFNPLESIATCDNKFETYQRFWKWNLSCRPEERIPLLPTMAAPMTYAGVGYPDTDFVKEVIAVLGLPLVIKECYGSFGMQVYLAETYEEVVSYTIKLAGIPFLYQHYQEASSGRDVRLQVVGDKVVAAIRCLSDHDFRANLSNGGRMEKYVPSQEECALAVRAAKVLGLDFAGVDLLFSEQGTADVICEVNSNAHFKNISVCTGVDTAKCIMEYIRQALV